eukprot:scaffold130079_cov51-Phaeocystis_antarctica.AAC.1
MMLVFAAAQPCAYTARSALTARSTRQATMMGLSKEDEMLTMACLGATGRTPYTYQPQACRAYHVPWHTTGDMVDAVCRGLTDNDRGAEDEGFSRLYQFMTPQGRTYMAPPPPRSGRLDGVALDFFVDNACDPVFGLVGCDYYTILETTVSPATIQP